MKETAKICLITGATSGIGLATAIGLARMNFQVVFTSISHDEGERTQAEIISITANRKVDFIKCDLSSLDEVRKTCDTFKARYQRLDVLINNAGVLILKREESCDGIEKTFAINYLAPQLITTLLLDTIKSTMGARIINLSSGSHLLANINFNDIEMKKYYQGIKAYAQTKLALVLLTKHLAGILKDTGVMVNAVHPGRVKTPLTNGLHPLFRTLLWLTMCSPEKGAETSIFVASSDEINTITGQYFVNKKVCKANPITSNPDLADKMWELGRGFLKKWID